MKEYDLVELSQFNGKEGKPNYIAHEGKVYDVGNSKRWPGGTHMKRHYAGNDLTTDIKAAPHGVEVLEKFPQVGLLKKEELEKEIPKALGWLLEKVPLLRRHPHPMTVHFPIVFTFAVVFFNILYLLTRIKTFEITALHCLGADILFTPVAIVTGLYTWWLNYLAKPLRPVQIKQRLVILLFILEIVVFVWRIMVPDILDAFGAASLIYFLLILAFVPLVTIIGWFGASMTFPVEK